MNRSGIRYNPGFLDDEELVRIFVVRKHDFDFVLETLRDGTGPTNGHILVVGPRGIGKTTLVRRVAAEVRTDQGLSAKWYPIVFSEESYEVCTPGEFWLAALFHLAGQTRDSKWLKAYTDLKLESDEVRLRERSLAQLMDFADEQGKRLILIVENVNMLLGEQLNDQDAWDLRHTLQNEPRVMLLGTATMRFEEIEHVDKAWFDIINIHELKPLDGSETQTLWENFTGEHLAMSRLRPVQILTGGSPRLISILAGFATKTSFRELMDNLVQLIDDHTEYFKGQLDSLAPTERKVFVALLDLWDPASAKLIAQTARLDVSKTSSLLNRLVLRGAVVVVKSGRKKLYQAAERLYNIYYLMRRRSHPAERVRAVVTFMVQFYRGDQLVTQAAKLAEEACHLGPGLREDHYHAYESIFNLTPASDRFRIVRATSREFFEMPDIPIPVRELMNSGELLAIPEDELSGDPQDATSWIRRGNALRKNPSRIADAEKAFRRALEIDPEQPRAWFGLGQLCEVLERPGDAERAYRSAVELKQDYRGAWSRLASILNHNLQSYAAAETAYRRLLELEPHAEGAWLRLGELLHRHLGRPEEAEQAFRKAIDLEPESFHSWTHLADFLMFDRKKYDEAERAFRKAIELSDDSDRAWAHLGALLHRVHRYDESERTLREAIKLNPANGWAFAELGHLLYVHLENYEEAEEVLRKAVELDPDDSFAWLNLANFLHKPLEQFEQAEQAYRKAIETGSNDADAWYELGQLLYSHLQRYEDSEQALRKAIDIDPGQYRAWICLGQLHTHLRQYEKAETSYRKAIELQPTAAEPLVQFGRFLQNHLSRYGEAEQAFQKAIHLSPDTGVGSLNLIELYLKNLGDAPAALQLAQQFADQSAHDAGKLNSLAWLFYESGPSECLPKAEAWACDAVIKSSNSWVQVHTLASVLGAQNKWAQALQLAPEFLDAASKNEEAIRPATDFIISAASAGFAKEALSIVMASKGANALEPLSVGLRIFLDDSAFIAQEIFEVGQDVARRIHDLQKKQTVEKHEESEP